MRSLLASLRLESNPSYLRRTALQIPKFSPSVKVAFLLSGARTRGSSELATSVDSPKIRALDASFFGSASLHLIRRSATPYSVTVESRLRVARRLASSNGVFGGHRFSKTLRRRVLVSLTLEGKAVNDESRRICTSVTLCIVPFQALVFPGVLRLAFLARRALASFKYVHNFCIFAGIIQIFATSKNNCPNRGFLHKKVLPFLLLWCIILHKRGLKSLSAKRRKNNE